MVACTPSPALRTNPKSTHSLRGLRGLALLASPASSASSFSRLLLLQSHILHRIPHTAKLPSSSILSFLFLLPGRSSPGCSFHWLPHPLDRSYPLLFLLGSPPWEMAPQSSPWLQSETRESLLGRKEGLSPSSPVPVSGQSLVRAPAWNPALFLPFTPTAAALVWAALVAHLEHSNGLLMACPASSLTPHLSLRRPVEGAF